MITTEHAVIRKAEADDAEAFRRLFDPDVPRSFVLDRRREIHFPTLDELRDVLGKKDAAAGFLYAIEDRDGEVRGFTALRGVSLETGYAEAAIHFSAAADYAEPIADEAADYLLHQAFVVQRLNKVVHHCMETEEALRTFLLRRGFESDGVQREVIYTLGRWLDLETLSLFQEKYLGGHHAR